MHVHVYNPGNLKIWHAKSESSRLKVMYTNKTHGPVGSMWLQVIHKLPIETLRQIMDYSISGRWLNQPIWKICSSKWVHLPKIGLKNKHVWNHHLDMVDSQKALVLVGGWLNQPIWKISATAKLDHLSFPQRFWGKEQRVFELPPPRLLSFLVLFLPYSSHHGSVENGGIFERHLP